MTRADIKRKWRDAEIIDLFEDRGAVAIVPNPYESPNIFESDGTGQFYFKSYFSDSADALTYLRAKYGTVNFPFTEFPQREEVLEEVPVENV